MSTAFRPLTPIRMADLFDDRMNDVGVREHSSEEAAENCKCLTDGQNYLWVHGDENGFVSNFARYGMMNAPSRILNAISEAFLVDIASEYEAEFWGFKTNEEWETAWREMEKEAEQNFNTAVRSSRDLPANAVLS